MLHKFFENKKTPFLLLIVFVSVFSIGILSRPLVGADSYYYYAFSCNKIGSLANKGFIAETFFSIIPCNELAWKLVSISLIVIASLIIGLIGFQYFGQKGWWLTPLSWFMLILPYQFASLEPMHFGIVFCFTALYFVLKNKHWIGLTFLVFAGTIWKGTIVFALLLGLLHWPFFLVALPFILLEPTTFFGSVFSRPEVAEQSSLTLVNFFGSLVLIPVVVIVLLFFFRFEFFKVEKTRLLNLDFDNKLFYPIMLALVLAGWAFKWAILGLPFFLLHFGKNFFCLNNYNKTVITVFLVFTCFGLLYSFSNALPNAIQREAVASILEIDLNVQNDWELGHWILAAGGIPSKEFGPSGFGEETFFSCDSRPVLTRYDLNTNFLKVREFGLYKIYECVEGEAELEK